MLKQLLKIAIVILLVVLLVSVRYFEDLFYDPLILFFKEDYLHNQLPEINLSLLFVNYGLRYFINSFISLILIWVIYHNKSYMRFSGYFYLISFVLLLSLLYFLLQINQPAYFTILFYVRRFIIQPVFILLLLPAFYYQQSQEYNI